MKGILYEKYEIIRKVGSGGSGSVYKAFDNHLNCFVAVKEFYNEDKLSEKEVEMLKTLKHPALPVITDYVEAEDRKYLVMEYIEGITLEEHIKRQGCIKQDKAVEWTVEIAQVLIYLHRRSQPVIYRDMKPANVIISDNGQIKLIDFGTAYFKHQGSKAEYVSAGTYGYAAPEQFKQRAWESVDERSDVYGLGATLHHMLTGSNPSLPPYTMQPLKCYNRALSGKLEKIVKKATAQEAEKRYQSVQQMEEELKQYKESDKKRKYIEIAAKGLYYALLFLTGGIFLYRCRYAESYGGTEYGSQVIEAAAFVLIPCLIKGIAEKIMALSYIRVGQIRNVYLSEKRNKGLMAVIFGVFTAVFLSVPQMVSAEAGLLHVAVRNEKGQKVLIRYDAVYCPEDDIQLELPLDNFVCGEEYILTLECTNRGTKDKKSRTFYLKAPKP